jgi:radical SAM protein with 4Fe4S-binding SPASM domain
MPESTSGPIAEDRSRRLVDEHLARATVLSENQRRNVRAKVDDLAAGRTRWESVPTRVQLELNRRCNLACKHCDIAHPWDSELDLRVVERLFEELDGRSMEVMPYAGGEPTLAPLERLAAILRRHNNYLSFTTNGVLFDEDLFCAIADATARVTISMHGHTAEIFHAVVPGDDFDRIAANMCAAVPIAEEHDIQLLAGLVLMDASLDHLAEWFHWIADMGFRHAGLTHLYPGTKRLDELGIYENRSRAEIEDKVAAGMRAAIDRGVFVETNVPEAYYTRWPENRPTRPTRFDVINEVNSLPSLFRPGFCPLVANMTTVEHDGTVLPCCRTRYPVGNVNRQGFLDVWNGERMQRLRETFLARSVYSGCARCMDFFCDAQHPEVPLVAASGRAWEDDFPA